MILSLLPEHHGMLQRDLLYTAVSRAVSLLVIVSTDATIAKAIGSTSTRDRNTALSHRLTAMIEAP